MKKEYEVGDKFIIEIDRTYASKNHPVSRYGIKGFSTLIFDNNGLDRLEKVDAADEKSYLCGMQNAWRVANQIYNHMGIGEVEDLFGMDVEELEKLDIRDVIKKLNEYEVAKSQQIHRCSVIEGESTLVSSFGKKMRGMVVQESIPMFAHYTVIDENGELNLFRKSTAVSTGKRFNTVKEWLASLE